ncbi:hypothetical protein FRX31_033084, partial [Thalictrum thalictroides]
GAGCIRHDSKERPKKKKKKRVKESGNDWLKEDAAMSDREEEEAGNDSMIDIHKEENIQVEEPVNNDMNQGVRRIGTIGTIDANYVADEDFIETSILIHATPESDTDANAEDAKYSSVAKIEGK